MLTLLGEITNSLKLYACIFSFSLYLIEFSPVMNNIFNHFNDVLSYIIKIINTDVINDLKKFM